MGLALPGVGDYNVNYSPKKSYAAFISPMPLDMTIKRINPKKQYSIINDDQLSIYEGNIFPHIQSPHKISILRNNKNETSIKNSKYYLITIGIILYKE